MDQFFEVILPIIVFIIIGVGKMLEAAQKREQQQKNSSRPRPTVHPKYRQQYQQPSHHGQHQTTQAEGYQASQEQIEVFLRDIGVLSQPIPQKAEEPYMEQQLSAENLPNDLRQTNKAVLQQVPNEQLTLSDPHSIPQFTSSNLTTSFSSLLHDHTSLKNAFILQEILQPPVSMRECR